MFGAGVFFIWFNPNDPSLCSFPIEYFGIFFATVSLTGVYYPGPGEFLESALNGLLAVIDLLGPSLPIICLC
jgi:hypothetical protein